MTPAMGSLASRSLDAVFWSAGGAVLRLSMQVGTQIALARLLGPAEYGVFAIAVTVIGFTAFFSDVGIAYGLIQKSTVDECDIRFVFTWQVVLGVLTTGLIYLGSSTIAEFFGEPRAGTIVQVLSTLCLINALTAPSLNLLKRQIDFKTIQIAHLTSYFIGYLLVGIPMALRGWQVWALVAAWMVQATINGVLLYRATRHPIEPLFWYSEARQQSSYGITVFVTNVVNWAVANIDRVIIARAFGSREIGLYATSFNLLHSPTANVLGVLQPVFFSASARIADDELRILGGYKMLLAAWSLLLLPVFVAVACVAETLVGAFYGAAWHEAAALCRPLALAMPMVLLFGLTTPLFWTSGQAIREFQLQAPMALLWAAACGWAATHSVVHVAWVVFALYALRCTVIVGMAIRSMDISLTEVWRSVRGGVLVSGLVAGSLIAADQSLADVPAWLRLTLDATVCFTVWLIALRLVRGLLAPELANLFERILSKLPAPLARQLAFLGRGGPR